MHSGIPVKIFPASLVKTHFDDPTSAFGITERQIREPIMDIQPVTTTGAATAITLTTGRFAPFGCTAITTTHILQ